VTGTTALVGAFNTLPSGTGAAYVYGASGGIWSLRATLTAADGAENDDFGFSLGLSGSEALIGAPGHSSNGAAYVFVQV
jgi:hypothetical protein